MKAAILFILMLSTGLALGQNKNEFHIVIEPHKTNYDTLLIQESVTDRIIAKVPLNKANRDYAFKADEITIASLSIKGIEKTYLTVLRPGVKKSIIIEPASVKTKQSIPDSLFNYLRTSTNQMLATYGELIFGEDDGKKIKSVFDSLVQVWHRQLNKFRPQMTSPEFDLLDYQNKAGTYSFLIFYGRMIKHYTPYNDYFNFIKDIDNEDPYSKSLPINLLYKYEIQILRAKDSIESIDAFLKFIETQTKTKDLQDFLKAYYIKSVIEIPFYWRRHQNLFTTTTIKAALERESANKYSYLISKASNSFYASQKGVKGYDFTALKLDGTELKLSDLSGKIVVIDTWATWCGPCVSQRPKMIEMAKKYSDRPEIVFLFVSVDYTIEKWKKYAARTNERHYGVEVYIPDGMNGKFGEQYLIRAIPKYILIDKDGIIIDSTLPEPSTEMEKVINRAIKKS